MPYYEKQALEKLLLQDLASCEKDKTEQKYAQLRRIFNFGRGHTEGLHIDMSEEDMLNRLVVEEKHMASTFEDKKRTTRRMHMALKRLTPALAEWYTEENTPEKTWNVNFPKTVGRGFKENGKEYESTAMRFVFRRGFRDEGYGFYLKTAYPAIDFDRCSRETGKQYTKEEALNKIAQKDIDPMRQTAFLYRGENPEDMYVMHGENKNHEKYLRASIEKNDKNNPTYLQMFQFENRSEYLVRTQTGRKRLARSEFQEKFPEEYVYFKSVENSYERACNNLPMRSAEKEFEATRKQIESEFVEISSPRVNKQRDGGKSKGFEYDR